MSHNIQRLIFKSKTANHKSLPAPEGPPVWLMNSASENYL